MLAVSDGETFRAMRRVARLEGLSMEPASSVAFAGLEKLYVGGHIQPGETVVVNCSGHTFSAEKHILEERYALHLAPSLAGGEPTLAGLQTALEQLDEQVRTIVIIDDNPNDSRLIRRFLQHYKQYRIFEAHNGPDGIDLVQQRKPDLVILDLTLPDMDGFTILSQLKDEPRTRDIPVIIVSAKALSEEEWFFLRKKTVSVWEKGNFRPQELAGYVVKMLGDNLDAAALPHKTSPASDFGLARLKRILIIDNNKREARLLHQLFGSRQKFELLDAYTSQEALAKITRTPPDLIVLDDQTLTGQERDVLTELCSRAQPAPLLILLTSENVSPLSPTDHGKFDSTWKKETLDRNSLLVHVEDLLLE
jgi:CheY-like chemotaxis protein